MQKICLIVNYNLYESKRHFTQKLAEAMHRQGIETMIIDMEEKSLKAETGKQIQNFHPDITCSFNSILPISQGKFLWDIIQIPHLSILVDPALYSANLATSPYSLISCVDLLDLDLLKSSGVKSAFFWPHAIEKELGEESSQERIYDVVFLGSCYDHDSLRRQWRADHDEEYNKMMDQAIELVLGDNKTCLAEALLIALNQSKLKPASSDFLQMFAYLDHYTRGRDRVELIRSIKNVPVHIFGTMSNDLGIETMGWGHYIGRQENVHLHPQVTYQESLNILKQSKICLNSMPFFKNGTHERIFASLACGAVPLTSDNLYIQEHFKPNENLLIYQSGQWDAVEPAIAELLNNETKRKEIAAAGRQKVMAEHTWDNRVSELRLRVPQVLDNQRV